MRADTRIDEYVATMGRRLRGPRRRKTDLVREVRDSLDDAAEAYLNAGLDPPAAARRAVADFGALDDLLPAYQAELAAMSVRALSRRMAVVATLLVTGADLMWRGAPWTGPPPPAGYQVLSGALDLLWLVCGVGAASTLAVQFRYSRHGRTVSVRTARAAAAVLAGTLTVAVLAGMAVAVWSLGIWPSARTWPPMVAGLLILAAAYVWLGVALRTCLITAGAGRRGLMPAPTAVVGPVVDCPGTGRR